MKKSKNEEERIIFKTYYFKLNKKVKTFYATFNYFQNALLAIR